METRKFEEAADALTILLTREQEDFWKADSYLDQSHVLIGLQKWEEAHESAQEGLSLKPYGTVQAGLHMTLADIDMHRMDYESAAANYLKATETALRAQQEAFSQEQLGRTLPVLIEGKGRTIGQLVGRSPFLQPVHFDAPVHRIGQLTEVRIDEG